MANTKHTKKGVLIDVKNLIFAELDADETSGVTYKDELQEVPGTVEIALAASVSEDVLGADGNPTYDILTSLDSIEATVTLAAIGKELESFLLGKAIDKNGVLVTKSSDSAPWVAMGFKTPRSDGSVDYIWLYKGKFRQGDETFRTKEKGTVNWQTPSIVGTFGPRDYDAAIKAQLNNKDADATAAVADFFASVYQPDATFGG